jgi:hypothetical protein
MTAGLIRRTTRLALSLALLVAACGGGAAKPAGAAVSSRPAVVAAAGGPDEIGQSPAAGRDPSPPAPARSRTLAAIPEATRTLADLRGPVSGVPGTTTLDGRWIDWNGRNFFAPCSGDCAISFYGGKEVTTSMLRIFFLRYPPKLFWEWDWRDNYLAAGAFSRRLVTFWNVLSIEPEFGVGQRFGDMHATEFWGAFNLRWIAFPWNHVVKTAIGVAEGLSVTTKMDPEERTLSKSKIIDGKRVYQSSLLQNFFTPEVTLALPRYPEYELLFRFHHRSGIFGLINGTHAGAQFYAVGFRMRF